MKNTLFIIICLLPLTLSAQQYTFYGSGSGKSYHKGFDGIYIGYHPAGMTHGRTVVFGEWNTRRSGSSLPLHKAARQSTTSATPAIKGAYNHADIKVINHRTSSEATQATSPGFDLGLSTEVNDYRASHSSSGSGLGFSSSSVVYGRTGGKMNSGNVSLSSFPVSLPELATTTTQSQETDGETVSNQGFLEPSSYYGPIGDPVVPMLILLSLLVVFRRNR